LAPISGVREQPEAVISAFADRWSIEDTFRAAKQSLGAEEP